MNPVYEERTKNLDFIEIGKDILVGARNELYLNMRFLDVALNSLNPQPSMELERTAADGHILKYNPQFLMDQYCLSNTAVNRCYLHSILHCLMGHVWNLRGVADRRLWDLACDIAAEFIIDGLPYRCLRNPGRPYRRAVYQGLEKKMPALNAEGIFYLLREAELDNRVAARLIQEFRVDEHFLWEQENTKSRTPMQRQNRWQDIRR